MLGGRPVSVGAQGGVGMSQVEMPQQIFAAVVPTRRSHHTMNVPLSWLCRICQYRDP